MQLTTKVRSAVIAMMDLALSARNGPVALALIGRRQGISRTYLEYLFGRLRRHGLIESVRGPGGGYALAGKAESIGIAEIMMAVDGLMMEADVGKPGRLARENSPRCSAPELWTSLRARIIELMQAVSLKKLADDQLAMSVSRSDEEMARRSGISLKSVMRRVKTNAPNAVFAVAEKSAWRSALRN